MIGPVFIGAGAKVCNGSYLVGPIVIGSNCVIGPNCFVRPYTVLADECRVGPGVELKNVLVGRQTAFYHSCTILDSIIGQGCAISAGTITLVARYDSREIIVKWHRKDHRTGLKKFGTIVGNSTVLSGNVVILPGKVIGENCRIGFNMTVDRNIPHNTFVRPRQELLMDAWSIPPTRWPAPRIYLEKGGRKRISIDEEKSRETK